MTPLRSMLDSARGAWWCTVLAPLMAACSPPDRPAGLAAEFPAAALEFLSLDAVEGKKIADGATYFAVVAPDGPWAMHLVVTDGGRCDLEAVVTPAPTLGETGRERAVVSAMVPHVEGLPYVGVNGDFFTDAGLPVGPETSETGHRPGNRPAFAWSPDDGAWIGLAGGEGGTSRYGGDQPADGHDEVVGGFPLLLMDGEVVGDLEVGERPSFAAARHPRTAVGVDQDSGTLWLVVVDGRSSESVGMSLPELTSLFHALGVEDAVNLDGGGSSTMWVRGRVVNQPSDPTGERPVANGLWLVDGPGRCGHS